MIALKLVYYQIMKYDIFLSYKISGLKLGIQTEVYVIYNGWKW